MLAIRHVVARQYLKAISTLENVVDPGGLAKAIKAVSLLGVGQSQEARSLARRAADDLGAQKLTAERFLFFFAIGFPLSPEVAFRAWNILLLPGEEDYVLMKATQHALYVCGVPSERLLTRLRQVGVTNYGATVSVLLFAQERFCTADRYLARLEKRGLDPGYSALVKCIRLPATIFCAVEDAEVPRNEHNVILGKWLDSEIDGLSDLVHEPVEHGLKVAVVSVLRELELMVEIGLPERAQEIRYLVNLFAEELETKETPAEFWARLDWHQDVIRRSPPGKIAWRDDPPSSASDGV